MTVADQRAALGVAAGGAVVIALCSWAFFLPLAATAGITPAHAVTTPSSTSSPAPSAAGKSQLKSVPVWVAPLVGTLWVKGDCKVGGRGGHWLARRSGHLHQGIDLGRPYGTPILSIHSGTVIVARYSVDGAGVGAGWYVRVNHGGGVFTSSMHLAGRPSVHVGQKVTAGQVTGRVGHSGTTSDHLHFQVHRGGSTNGYTVNPSTFLRTHGIQVKGC